MLLESELSLPAFLMQVLQQRSEEAAEILEEKVKFAEEEANLLAKQATEAQQEILRIRQENNKVIIAP